MSSSFHVKEIIGAVKIFDGLFLGDELTAHDFEFFIKNKVRQAVNIGSELSNSWEEEGVKYLNINWEDTDTQTLFGKKNEELEKVYEFIEEGVETGESTLVFSLKGQNRAGTLIAAYLMKKFSWSVDKALLFIKSKKWTLSIRPAFVSQLRSLSQSQSASLSNEFSPHGIGFPPDSLDQTITNTFLNTKHTSSEEANKKLQFRKKLLEKSKKQSAQTPPPPKKTLKSVKWKGAEKMVKAKPFSASNAFQKTSKGWGYVEIIDNKIIEKSLKAPLKKPLKSPKKPNQKPQETPEDKKEPEDFGRFSHFISQRQVGFDLNSKGGDLESAHRVPIRPYSHYRSNEQSPMKMKDFVKGEEQKEGTDKSHENNSGMSPDSKENSSPSQNILQNYFRDTAEGKKRERQSPEKKNGEGNTQDTWGQNSKGSFLNLKNPESNGVQTIETRDSEKERSRFVVKNSGSSGAGLPKGGSIERNKIRQRPMTGTSEKELKEMKEKSQKNIPEEKTPFYWDHKRLGSVVDTRKIEKIEETPENSSNRVNTEENTPGMSKANILQTFFSSNNIKETQEQMSLRGMREKPKKMHEKTMNKSGDISQKSMDGFKDTRERGFKISSRKNEVSRGRAGSAINAMENQQKGLSEKISLKINDTGLPLRPVVFFAEAKPSLGNLNKDDKFGSHTDLGDLSSNKNSRVKNGGDKIAVKRSTSAQIKQPAVLKSATISIYKFKPIPKQKIKKA